ncbi:hypothetical protein Cfor_02338 [Coptotermes formosanus]|uniref:Replication factor C subunit 1 n=1 Tax=Coptotermes formosanus TaxID=36987 RepID=A0A6L2PZJ9_COPFO|nr:hypothetical protein Cfor_02338 [Coptotermes formosanus]
MVAPQHQQLLSVPQMSSTLAERDIRSYFLPNVGSEKEGKSKEAKRVERHRKRRVVVIDSDSDEDFQLSPVKKRNGNPDLSASCARDVKQKTDKDTSTLKPVEAADVFGNSHIKRTVLKKPAETHKVMEKDVKLQLENQHSDTDFEATLRLIDEQKYVHTREKEKTPVKEKQKPQLHTSEFSTVAVHSHTVPRNVTKETLSKTAQKLPSERKENKGIAKPISQPTVSPDLTIKNKEGAYQSIRNEHNHEEKDESSPPATKRSDDVFEKKRQHAMQYQRYLQREGPKNPGGKVVPQGEPGCLAGLVFVVTGVLETIEREEATSIIKQCGGRVTSSVSRNTSYIVVGYEPGPSKIEKATKLNIKQLTEDGLFDLIRTKSGSPDSLEILPNSSKKNIQNDEEFKQNGKSCLNAIMHETKVKTSKDIKNDFKKDESAVHENKSTLSPSPPAGGNIPESHSLWADKYKPLSTKQIIGQQGDRSNVKKLMKWLQEWHSNHSGKKKLVRPSPWAKDDTGAFFKAALLSGPPGVGAAGRKPTENHVLVMDEVDGMAGNEDRGGIQELIQLIKSSRVPVICTCNDRRHPKIRSLTNYCFDLQFSRPNAKQILGAMMSICFKEGIKVPPEALNDIITGANHDIRQVLHHLSLWSVKDKQLSIESIKEETQKAKKDIKLGPWDVLKKVFSADAHKTMSIRDKSDLFFHDYSLGPLFVQENYLGVMPHKARDNRNRLLELVARTAESISSGDIVEKTIRSKNSWNLLPLQAMFSSVLPGDFMEGHLTCQINFPAWLGKNSHRNKFQRILQELHGHMRLCVSGSKEAVNMDYLTHLRDSVVGPLIKEGLDGVPATLHVMQSYYLLRDDIDSLMELSSWPNQKDPMSHVNSKVKAALTHRFNKEGVMTPYSIVNIKKFASKSNQDLEFDGDGQDVQDDEEKEEEDDITRDAMIKAKKRRAAPQNPASGGSRAKKQRVDNKGDRRKNATGKRK